MAGQGDLLDKHCVLCLRRHSLGERVDSPQCRAAMSESTRILFDLTCRQVRREKLSRTPAGVTRALEINREVKKFLRENTPIGE